MKAIYKDNMDFMTKQEKKMFGPRVECFRKFYQSAGVTTDAD